MAFLALLNVYCQWFTVSLLADAEPAFTEASIRYHIFQAQSRCASSGQQIAGNGLAPAIRKVGRKVVINHGLFLDWVAGKDISQVDLSALMRNGEDISHADPSDNPPPKREPASGDGRMAGLRPRSGPAGRIRTASRTTGQLNG